MKMVFSGRGWFELVESRRRFGDFYYMFQKCPGCYRGRALTDDELAVRRKANHERSVRRAKTMVRRKVKNVVAGGEGYFLTLTYRENMQDYDRFLSDFEEFVSRVRDVFPGFAYVAVAERQKRGAWHVHLVTNIHMDVRQWSELWGHGYVWIERARECRRAIRYITKYLQKAFEREEMAGKKRYLCSQGLLDDVVPVYMEGVLDGFWRWLREAGYEAIVELDVTFNEEGMRWLEGKLLRSG